jgi:hypothetical protein
MRVLLYGDWPLALTYLNPLAKYISQHEPSWQVSFAGDLGMEYPLSDDKPDVVITCDELSVAPDAPVKVCIFHGLASKAQAFSTLRRSAFADTTQLFAVPGPYYKELLLDLGVGSERIKVTGVTKFDWLTRNILYAPTHNIQLSAIPVIGDRIYELPNVKVHLHQYIRTGDLPHQQQFRSYYSIHEDREDIHDLLQWADVIIGDFGSIVLEGIALGKQAIQVVNPHYEDWYVRVQGLTWEEMVRLPEFYLPAKYGKRVYSFDELKESLGAVENIGGASASIVEWIKQEIQTKHSTQ